MQYQYKDPGKISKNEALQAFREGKPDVVARALLGLALYGNDNRFTESWCLFFLGGCNEITASAAVTAIAHLARTSGCIERQTVVPALEIVRAQGRIAGVVDDALDDIATYCAGPSLPSKG
jgi:hypothetical protein